LNILIYDVDCSSSGIHYPIEEALRSLGHTTYMFDWKKYLYNSSKIRGVDKIKNIILSPIIIKNINKELCKIIEENYFDFFLVLRGDYIQPETLDFAKNYIKTIANWNTDDLFNKVASSNVNPNTFTKYDVHFSPRENLKMDYLNLGAKRFEIIHWYYRYGLEYQNNLIQCEKYINDGSFVGSWSKRRECILDCLADENITIHGWGWKNKINKRNDSRWKVKGSLSIIEMNNFFHTSKININILTIENRDVNNLRNFEIPAAGGFQLTERSESILSLFKEDSEIVCYSSNDELISKYKFYIKNDNLRKKIALAGQKKVFATNNSLEDRLKQIIKIINQYDK
jgi:spore maturation protein CgeB